MEKSNLKISFNCKTQFLKEKFEEKVLFTGKSKTVILNELIQRYVEGTDVSLNNNESRVVIKKLLLMMQTDNINKDLIGRELDRLWNMVQ